MTTTKRVKIMQALARGYCSKENEHKTVDAGLIKAMTDEVMALPNPVAEGEDKHMCRKCIAARLRGGVFVSNIECGCPCHTPKEEKCMACISEENSIKHQFVHTCPPIEAIEDKERAEFFEKAEGSDFSYSQLDFLFKTVIRALNRLQSK